MRMHAASPRRWLIAAAALALLLAAIQHWSGRVEERAALPAPAEPERPQIRLRERGLEFLEPGEHLA